MPAHEDWWNHVGNVVVLQADMYLLWLVGRVVLPHYEGTFHVLLSLYYGVAEGITVCIT